MTDNRLGTLHSHLHVRVPRSTSFPGLEPKILSQAPRRFHVEGANLRFKDPELVRRNGRLGHAFSPLSMNVNHTSRIAVAGLFLSMVSAACFAQGNTSTYDPLTQWPSPKRTDGFVDSTLKRINPCDTDYGQHLDEVRKMVFKGTIESAYFWSNIVSLGLLGGLFTPGVTWSPPDIAAIEGHPNHVNSIVFDSIYWTALADPTNPCAGVSDAQRYDPQTNPDGARCRTLADYMINVLGPRPKRVWSKQEKEDGHGFGAIPLSDVGVQFGLNALKDAAITPAQFIDLNLKIGGANIDLGHTKKRLQATRRSLRNAYRSGGINETNNLAGTAIIDLRGPDPGAFHDAYRSFAIRARLEREQGHFPKNQVIWYGQTPLIGDPRYTTEGLLAMDEWLTDVEKDKRHVSLAKKVASDRPKDVHDQCSSVPHVSQVNLPGVGKVCKDDLAQTKFGTPATVAGESIATDSNRCRLQPLTRSSYYPINFTGPQWKTLKKVFPTGVCDWSKPGIEQQPTIPWQTYERNADGSKVIYGGRRWARRPAARVPGGPARRSAHGAAPRSAASVPSLLSNLRTAAPSLHAAFGPKGPHRHAPNRPSDSNVPALSRRGRQHVLSVRARPGRARSPRRGVHGAGRGGGA